MDKSIESIWKEGFLKNDALLVPKLNDLYNQKSTHLVDKFKRRFKVNLKAIVIFSFIVLILSFLVGIPVMGVMMFFLFNGLVIVNNKLLKGLEKIDKNVSSYQYLKSFNDWMKEQISVNRRMAGFYYPYIFIALTLGFWFSSFNQDDILGNFNQIYLVNGIPVYWTISFLLITGLLAIFGGRIYTWEVGVFYGNIINKLEELITDIEELRS
ncbi:MAG: hypothetical protein ACJAT4_002073 [Granulosicoccus sp.]|jgi:hypothetical protein